MEIHEPGHDRYSFQYNGNLDRANMFYGSMAADKLLRPLRRHYSADGSVEISKDLTAGTTTFVFYLGGDAYSAPAIWKETYSSSPTVQQFFYLHRDYLGSIVLITNAYGYTVEKRQFDAWGNIVRLQDGANNNLPNFTVIDRGFTGHEHLLPVGLIHMNARLYDPLLGRFLAPYNYVQDPFGSQSFNRYGYALNNPLVYVDQNGEFFWWILAAALIFTDIGYDVQKALLPIAVHVDFNFGSNRRGIGLDVSAGLPQILPVGVRSHGGASYYWRNYGITPGWEFRYGAEVNITPFFVTGFTEYNSPGTQFDQRVGHVRIGTPLFNVKYANDWFFGSPQGDGGDRYRTTAVKLNVFGLQVGINLFTGDPGLNKSDRRIELGFRHYLSHRT